MKENECQNFICNIQLSNSRIVKLGKQFKNIKKIKLLEICLNYTKKHNKL